MCRDVVAGVQLAPPQLEQQQIVFDAAAYVHPLETQHRIRVLVGEPDEEQSSHAFVLGARVVCGAFFVWIVLLWAWILSSSALLPRTEEEWGA